jgi:hypothetical protein
LVCPGFNIFLARKKEMKQIVAIAYLTGLMILAAPFFTIDLAEAELSGLIRGRVINQSLSQKGVEGNS